MGGTFGKLVVWAACMALLALTVGLTFVPLGPFRLGASLVIAAAKAGLICWVYMELREADGIERIAALIAFFFLAILIGLSTLDVAVRAGAFR